MSNEQIFADRLKRINSSAHRQVTQRKATSRSEPGARMVAPLMMSSLLAGVAVFTWELMDRPTDNPLQLASNLTAQVLSD